MYKSILLLTSLSTLTLAQFTNLSSNCEAAATSLISNTALSTCINLIPLVSVLSATGSVITPLDSWLTGACSQTCSAATLSNASAAIEAGCSTDIASGSAIAVGIEALFTNYTNIKNVLCLTATSNSTHCLTTLLTAVQTSSNTTLSVNSVTSLLTGGITAISSLFTTLTPAQICTDCNKALLSKVEVISTASSSALTSLESELSTDCGAGFVDGTVPSTVSEGNGTASTTTSANGGSVSSTSLGGAGVKNLGTPVGWVVGFVLTAFAVGTMVV